jgi:flagellar M-ring protein FliF
VGKICRWGRVLRPILAGPILVQGFFDFLKSLGAARMAAMAGVTVMMVGFFAFIIMRMTTPQMVPLFTDLSVEDSSAIIKDLERQAILYEIKNDGAIILVPKDKTARLRMKLAEAGLPKGGGVGYEIFDKSDALGATSFIQNINHLRALEGELARTIRGLDRVQSARVHLVLPERPLFARERAEPSASIVINSRGRLEPAQVRAIRHLVATAVNGLKPERVSIVDETGRLLADGSLQDQNVGVGADERKINYERRLREQVEQIVSSVVGSGRARVQLNADFDFNRITQTSDRFDPEGRVVRSSQTREEQSQTNAQRDEQVSVGNELPGGQRAGEGNPTGGDQNKKTEEIVNYEISRTTKTEVTEAGRINRISVAVLVDGTYSKNDKGETVYQPRSKEDLDRISALVRSAVGFDQKRGDQLEVINLRFAEQPATLSANEPSGFMSLLQFSKDDIMRTIELAVMSILGLLALLMVVRPMMRRAFGTDTATKALPRSASASDTPALPPASGSGAIANSGGPNVAIVGSDEAVAISNRTSTMIDVAQVQGQVHAQSVQKVGELANKNPQEAIAIIRSWLHEAA